MGGVASALRPSHVEGLCSPSGRAVCEVPTIAISFYWIFLVLFYAFFQV